jgi:hypothetical protein
MLMENLLRSKKHWSVVKHGIIEVDKGVDPIKGQKKVGWSETQGSEGERLSFSSHWYINLRGYLE